MRDPAFRTRTLLVSLVLLTVFTVPDVIAFNAAQLKGDFLLVWVSLAAVVGPANAANVGLLRKFGRVWPAALALVAAGAAAAAAAAEDGLLPQLGPLFAVLANLLIYTAQGQWP